MKIITEDFEAAAPDSDESLPPGLAPDAAVEEIAFRKAESVARMRPSDIVIGADTVVALDGRILGKPRDNHMAKEMLTMLSGRSHEVFTGVAIIKGTRSSVFSRRTSVKFRDITEKEIDDYILSGEPADKAGAYGIQNKGALFVESIDGDYFNVVGFPVSLVYGELSKFM